MSAQKKAPMNFKTMMQSDVPQGRNGKHKQVISQIMSDLDQIADGMALKIPLAELTMGKEKVRSALNRAIHKTKRSVTTATDEQFLYIWNQRGITGDASIEEDRQELSSMPARKLASARRSAL